MARLGNTLIQDQITILGTILQGEENAKEGLVVWPCENFRPGEVTIYAAGFSGETAQVKAPASRTRRATTSSSPSARPASSLQEPR